MAMAPVAYTLWQRFLRFDPADPIWPNRDRFVLSAGHASMLLYSLLHLTKAQAVDPDYETLGEPSVSLDDIESFRQLGSKAAGHPEYHLTSGVETTTGPLGQGIATTVGMAIGGKWLGAHFGAELFDFDVYAICGDGDLMEGVSGEAGSIAGHQRLDNLCWIYDNNHISIDGRTELAYSDDVAARFVGYGWNVTRVGDANDLELLTRAFEVFKREEGRPTLIIVDSHIGYGSPHKQDTRRGPRGAAGRRRGARDEARLRLARGRRVPDPRRRLRAFRRWDRRTRPQAARRVGAARRGRRPEARRADRPDATPGAAGGLGRRDPELRGRSRRDRDPKGVQPGAERDRPASAVAPQRLGGPHGVGRQRPDLRRRGHLLARGPLGPRPPLRDSRARVGRDLQRAGALQAAPGLVDLPDLLRLRPPGDPPLGAHGAAGDPLVQPRLDRPRRGRPDPPAR